MRRIRTRLPGRAPAAAVAVGAVLGLVSVPPAAPSPTTDSVAATADNTATVFYWTKTKNWDRYNLHYAPDGGAWTAVPGVAMEPDTETPSVPAGVTAWAEWACACT